MEEVKKKNSNMVAVRKPIKKVKQSATSKKTKFRLLPKVEVIVYEKERQKEKIGILCVPEKIARRN